jgi:hypothetical protein
LREESTRYGKRIHYSSSEVPGVIEEAREMFWEPFRGWKAWLRCGRHAWDPYEIAFRVHWRYVFRGKDHDVARLLAAFQEFLDRNIDRVDQPSFRCCVYAPDVHDSR